MRLAILLVCSVPLGGAAQDAGGASADPGRTFKRAAIVTGALTAAFAGVGTVLVVTQPEESFAAGVGVGHLLWSPGLAAQTIMDVIMMTRARRAPRATRATSRVLNAPWVCRLNIALWGAMTAGGLGALIAGLTIDDQHDVAGVGAVVATYAAAGLVFSLWDLVQTKRRIRKCRETCPAPAVTGALAIRF